MEKKPDCPKMEQQIDEQFRKAFYDNIHQAVAADDHATKKYTRNSMFHSLNNY